MNELNDIGESLEASLAKDTLVDIMSGLGDSTIEMLLELGDSIPVFSYFTKGVKAANEIRDFIFLEKVVKFLTTLGEVPTSERLRMIDKIQSDSKYNEKFGKFSLIALDLYEDKTNAQLLGIAAKYLARDEISFSFYKRISFIIGRLFIDDLLNFANDDNRTLRDISLDFESLGLLKTDYKMVDVAYLERNGLSAPKEPLIKRKQITNLGIVIQLMILDKHFTSSDKPFSQGLDEYISELPSFE